MDLLTEPLHDRQRPLDRPHSMQRAKQLFPNHILLGTWGNCCCHYRGSSPGHHDSRAIVCVLNRGTG